MPVVLILAFAASLGVHVALLFGTQIELPTEIETPPLMAELKPAPIPRPPPQLEAPPSPPRAKPRQPAIARRQADRPASASSVLSVPDAATPLAAGSTVPAQALAPLVEAEPVPESVADSAPPPENPPPVAERLPPHGIIRYRVDRGDSNFEIGAAEQRWTIVDGRYRLSSVVETTGLVWLFKAIRIEMESRGLITAAGLQPQTFAIRRDGQPARETADFDWSAMTVRVAGRGEQPLDDGAQDLLSFNYQLGYLPHLDAGGSLPIATGKRYGVYRLEVLGDEDIEVPAGAMRTLHLRAPGTNTTELWLAYDYLLLPVKIRHVDAKGGSFVQVATKIEVGDAGDQKPVSRRDGQGDAGPPR